MYKKEGMEDVVRWLKSMGCGITIVCMTNASVIRLQSCCKDVLPAVECLDGVLFSADVRDAWKPQKEIYGHLLSGSIWST
ncbi:MAG: hypothetical protein ACLTW9_11610 [Enterocloster sp.]